MMRMLIALMLLLTGAAHAEPDSLAEAQRAQEAGDYARAATLFLPLASNGNPVAQFNLGVLYTQGQVIQRDYRIAMQWYLASAEQGNSQAQANLGELYATGPGIPQDFTKALRWLTYSAKQGNATAQLHLGELYAEGRGAPQDFQEAIKWYRHAAAQGNAGASSHLAECYANGQGTPQDSTIAVEWLNKAAGYATDMPSRSVYLARRDAIAMEIKNREIAKQQKLIQEAAERVRLIEIARAETARKLAEQAAIAQAAEQGRQKAAADAALELQIKVYKQAKIEAQTEKLKAQQEAIAKRKTDSARYQSEREARLNAIEDRRRAEINAEVARNLAAARKNREAQAKVRHSVKLVQADEEHPLLHDAELQPGREQRTHKTSVHVKAAENTPIATARPEQEKRKNFIVETKTFKPKIIAEQRKALKASNVSTGKMHYPAKVELTDAELGNGSTPGGAEHAKAPIKQINWSKKSDNL